MDKKEDEKQITLILSKEAYEELIALKVNLGLNKVTEVIPKSIALMKFLDKEMRKGKKLLLQDDKYEVELLSLV